MSKKIDFAIRVGLTYTGALTGFYVGNVVDAFLPDIVIPSDWLGDRITNEMVREWIGTTLKLGGTVGGGIIGYRKAMEIICK